MLHGSRSYLVDKLDEYRVNLVEEEEASEFALELLHAPSDPVLLKITRRSEIRRVDCCLRSATDL